MKKIDKYLQQIRLYRIEQQINKSTFEMALYFDFFGINENEIKIFIIQHWIMKNLPKRKRIKYLMNQRKS